MSKHMADMALAKAAVISGHRNVNIALRAHNAPRKSALSARQAPLAPDQRRVHPHTAK